MACRTVIGCLRSLALVLAAIGLDGVVGYPVTRRLHAIGIRMPLGAGKGAVEWLVLREVAGLLFAGLILGPGKGIGPRD